jgi:hypothetical protein
MLSVNEMKEAIADWAEKTTGKRPDLDDVSHSSWGQGQWWFAQSPWDKKPPLD